MTIKKRIQLSSVFLLALFVVMGGVNMIGTNSVMNRTSIAYLLEKANMHAQGIFRGVNEFIIDEGEPLSIELAKRHVTGFDEILTSVTAIINNKEIKQILFDSVQPQWNIVKSGTLQFIENNPEISVDDDKAMLEYGRLTNEAKKLIQEVEALSESTKMIAETTAKKISTIITAVAAVIMVLISYLLFNLYRSITKPIMELNLLAEGISKGNLNILMNDSRNDEFGKVASYLNKATLDLSRMISNIKDATVTLSTNSRTLSQSSSEIAGNTEEQSNQTTQAASAIEELSASFQDVAQNTSEAAQSTKEAVQLAFQSADVITGTVTSMNNISESANQSSYNIKKLSSGSEQIEEIVKVIHDIAGQTNLLALNAAIEAARAGEQGRGFAVVADEVRKLAEKTTASTKEIGEMIENIQATTAETISSMETWKQDVVSGLDLANQAGNALQMIVVSITNVTQKVENVAAAADEQSTTAGSISSSVESVAQLTQRSFKNAQQTSESAHMLNGLAQELRQMVSGFTLRDQGKIAGGPRQIPARNNDDREKRTSPAA